MPFKWKLKEWSLYRLGETVLLSWICLYLFGSYMGIGKVNPLHLCLAAFTCAALAVFFACRGGGRLIWAVFFAAAAFMAVFFTGFRESADILYSYGSWLLASGEWQAEYALLYEVCNTVLLAAVLYGCQMLGDRYFVVKRAAGFVLFFYLIGCMVFHREIQYAGVTMAFVYMVILCGESAWRRREKLRGKRGAGISVPEAVAQQDNRNKGRETDKRAPFLWLVPFMVIYFVMLSWMPVPQKPYDWKFAKAFFKEMGEVAIILSQKLERLNGGEQFDIAFSGFSGKGSLLGNILNNERDIMEVTVETGQKTNIYLIGKTFNEFNGREWIQTDTGTEEQSALDTLETLYAVQRWAPERIQDYVSWGELRIRYNYFDTEHVFMPLKSCALTVKDSQAELAEQGGSLYFPKRKGYGTEYAVSYMQLNLDAPEFYEMLNGQRDYRYGQRVTAENREKLTEIQGKYGLQLLNNRSSEFKKPYATEEELRSREAYIHQEYGEPVTLSSDVRAYLDNVIAGADTEVAKCQAIEGALTQLKYTTSPGDLPEVGDFLEYFLFEKKEGYCSYFATAFVLLARAEGIPARYVQGFCMRADDGSRKTFTVTSGMAHAWPEVYLTGAGWIPFEPTPGYGVVRYTPWEREETVKGGNGSLYMPDERGEADAPSAEETQEAQDGLEESAGWDPRLPLLIGGTLLIAAVCSVLLLLLDAIYVWYRYKRMTPGRKLRADVYAGRCVLALLGYALQEGETLSELRNRAREGIGESCPALHFLESYEEVKYGERQVTEALLMEILEERGELLALLKSRKGKKYPYYRIRLYFMRNKGEQGGV